MFIEIFLYKKISKYQYILLYFYKYDLLVKKYDTIYDFVRYKLYSPSLYNHSYVTQKLPPSLPFFSFNHSIRYHISHYLYHHYHHVVDVIDMANFSNFLEIHAKLKHYRYSQYHQMVFQNLM